MKTLFLTLAIAGVMLAQSVTGVPNSSAAGGASGASSGTITSVFGNAGPVVGAVGDIGATGKVLGVNGVPLCTGFTPTTGQNLQYTTASSPNPCYTAAAGGNVTTTQACTLTVPSTSSRSNGDQVICTNAPFAESYVMISGAWQWFADGFAATQPPASSTLSWVNQGSGTVADQWGGLFITAPSGSGDSLKCLFKSSYPSTPYTFTVGVLPQTVSAGTTWATGIAVSDGTKLLTLQVGYLIGSPPLQSLQANYWTNTTTYLNSPLSPVDFFAGGKMVYLTISDNGTNLIGYASVNPMDPTRNQLFSVSRTAFMSGGPTKVGVMVNNNNATYGSSVFIPHWSGI